MLKKTILFLCIFSMAALVYGETNKKDMAPYSPELSKQTMQTILGAMIGMKPAMEANDFSAIEANFKVFETSFQTMSGMKAPTGDQETWMRINGRMVELSQMGQMAAKENNMAKIGEIMGEVQVLNKEGHGLFQKY